MKLLLALLCIASPIFQTKLHADTFGSGGNTFAIDFVTVGDPGNPDDAGTSGDYFSPYGGVAYTFRIGKYEISESMIAKANDLGNLQIGVSPTRGPNHPATYVSWNAAARFVNWLNISNGFPAAYKFAFQPGQPGYDSSDAIQLWTIADAGYDPGNLFRNANARYFLPSEDEWYKAAYYSGSGSTYFDYATQQDNQPPSPTSDGTDSGTAVWGGAGGHPAEVTRAGGLSHYGTMAQNGNVYEWMESAYDGLNDLATEGRELRGGNWDIQSEAPLRSSSRFNAQAPQEAGSFIGFRVASVPEPSTVFFGLIGLLGISVQRRRKCTMA